MKVLVDGNEEDVIGYYHAFRNADVQEIFEYLNSGDWQGDVYCALFDTYSGDWQDMKAGCKVYCIMDVIKAYAGWCGYDLVERGSGKMYKRDDLKESVE